MQQATNAPPAAAAAASANDSAPRAPDSARSSTYRPGVYLPAVDGRRREFHRTPPPAPRPSSRDAWPSVSPPSPAYAFRAHLLQTARSSGYGGGRRAARAQSAAAAGPGAGAPAGARQEVAEGAVKEGVFKVGRDKLVMVRTPKGAVAFDRFPGEAGR